MGKGLGGMRTAVGSRVRRSRRWVRRQQADRAERRELARPPAPPRVASACYAPHTALYLRPDGIVQSCCATGFQLGTVFGPEAASLPEIWEGANLQSHREWLEADRFDLGCQECEVAIETGGRASSLASHFDRWRVEAPYPYPKLLDLALSSRCNLQCVMCNGELSSAIRTQREGRAPMPAAYDDAFFDDLAIFLPHAERVHFKGGEPFLAPENMRVWDIMIEQGSTAEVAITTNGTFWNDRVERYVRELRATILVSVDGMTADSYEAIRIGADFDKVWANIDRFQAVTDELGTSMTLSFCFMRNNWQQLPAFLDEIDRRDVNGYVILVNQPDEYDILKAPDAEVASILEQLEADPPALATERSRPEWNRVINRLRSHLVAPTVMKVTTPPATFVTIGPRRKIKALDVDDLRRRLADGVVDEVGEVRVHEGTVVGVHPPAWGEHLGIDRWLGMEETAIVGLLEELIGEQPEVEFRDGPDPRVAEALITWPGRAELDLRVWVVALPTPGGPIASETTETRWLLAPGARITQR